MLNVNAFDTRRAALLMMHYQADVFAVLFGKERPELIDRANVHIQVQRSTGRPVIFANFALGERYEMVNPDNRLVSGLKGTGLHRVAIVGGAWRTLI